ncbi:MAG: D-alanine-D-alanine ligase [Microgenomates group bacterium GW2011_GWC1_39_7b]|nr:MAG: D-alanine-D-alanine ligase [Microgenomates group bacterium GW2011_GWC1_39_7b]KKS90703.1 MAG: D-alanine-D-alanine ligase [Candidatus Woesebacteria bacterium GW2011_GWA1_43_12]
MLNFPKGKKLAFVYNVRHVYPDSDDPSTFNEADFDDQETIDSIVSHLKNLGLDVLPIEANTQAEPILIDNKTEIGFVLNYSEEVFKSEPKTYMAEVLERVGLPFSGCFYKTQKIIINKGEMKRLLLIEGVSTLPYQVFEDAKENLDSQLRFPLIVKPIARGSSAGITNKSIVNNNEELSRQVKFVLDTFNEPALVEPFIEGREFSVGMLGNPPEIFPIIEPLHDKLPKDFYHIDSMEVKWKVEDELGVDYFKIPADTGNDLKSNIENLCRATWNTLEIRDFCRIDLRINQKNNIIYVLDVNSPPGLIPPEISTTSYFPMAAKVKGYNYEDLLSKIIDAGLSRYQ